MTDNLDDKIKKLLQQTEPNQLSSAEIETQFVKIQDRIQNSDTANPRYFHPIAKGLLLAAGLSLLVYYGSTQSNGPTVDNDELYGALQDYASYDPNAETNTQTYQDWLEFSEADE